MKLKINTIKIGSILAVLALPLAALSQQVVNLSDWDNFAAEYGNNQYNAYVGPGAYAGSTSSDFWNGFGLENDGNHPYPGTGLLSDSTGTPTGITYSINYDGNNGGLYFDSGPYQGTPAFLLGQAALANGTDVGTLTLNNVSAGSYDLYLYGANYDGDRGALFTVNSGTPVGGLSATTNPNTGGPMNTFILGGNYVEFTGVTPDINGNINITWAQNTSDSHGGGEGDFNGMSLVATAVPEPTTLAFIGLGIAGFVAARRRK